MDAGSLGLLTGLICGFALAVAGFGAFLLVLFLGAVGLTVGKVISGEVDVVPYLERSRARGRDRHDGDGRRW